MMLVWREIIMHPFLFKTYLAAGWENQLEIFVSPRGILVEFI